jgi:hypothetical protein
MKPLIRVGLACLLTVVAVNSASAIGRWRRPKCRRPVVCCPVECRAPNPCICPQDELVMYPSGGYYYSIYSTLVHQCECASTPCSTPDNDFLEAEAGRPLHQECEEGCDISRGRYFWGAGGLEHGVDLDYLPEDPDNASNRDPVFSSKLPDSSDLSGPPKPYGDPIFICFQRKQGDWILAKAFHYIVPKHTHDDGNPSTPDPEYSARPVHFGFQCKSGPLPPKVECVPYEPKAVRCNPKLGSCLYVVQNDGIEYGIVVVGPCCEDPSP